MRCVSPKIIWPHRSVEWQDKNDEYPLSVPCGKCLACLSNRRQEWVFRLEQEQRYSKGSLFVTLTYDEKHLPSNRQLNKRDVQLYIKRLRKSEQINYGNQSIRYFLCGEYGSISGRPHYHLLLFNAHEGSVRGAWMDSKGAYIGIVHVGSVTQASISYCTKYIVQPVAPVENWQGPFTLMSRRFGIGGRYLSDEMVQWHRVNGALYSVRDGQEIRLSRFYKSKIWYSEDERERLSKVALGESLKAGIRLERYWRKKFGEKWESKYIEMRNAMLARIKTKVAFTQHL